MKTWLLQAVRGVLCLQAVRGGCDRLWPAVAGCGWLRLAVAAAAAAVAAAAAAPVAAVAAMAAVVVKSG